MQLVIEGQADAAYRVAFDQSRPVAFAPWTADGRAHWIRADVRDGQGHPMLIGNPIYVAPR